MRSAIDRAGVPLDEVWSGDRLRSGGGARIEVLHPPRGGVLGSDNANSIVLAIEYQGRRLLLTGDLESPGLDDVMAEEPYDCDVLLAPHHGSASSDPPGFAAWSTPEWTVVSGGRRDRLARRCRRLRGARQPRAAHRRRRAPCACRSSTANWRSSDSSRKAASFALAALRMPPALALSRTSAMTMIHWPG